MVGELSPLVGETLGLRRRAAMTSAVVEDDMHELGRRFRGYRILVGVANHKITLAQKFLSSSEGRIVVHDLFGANIIHGNVVRPENLDLARILHLADMTRHSRMMIAGDFAESDGIQGGRAI